MIVIGSRPQPKAAAVEERALRAALVPLVRAAGVDDPRAACVRVDQLVADRGEVRFDDGGGVTARLVVAADGLRSRVREAAGIAAAPKPVRADGASSPISPASARTTGVRDQWFRDDGGILAWLPLPGRRISIVWSAPDALAPSCWRSTGTRSPRASRTPASSALGALDCITPAAGFPLQLLKLPAVVAHRLALVGDAAHGVHPLAGQGVNLGFGDAEALAAVLRERGPVADAGAPMLLERYARRRAEPVAAMQTVTDGLARLFRIRAPARRRLRNLGMAAVDRLPPAKRAAGAVRAALDSQPRSWRTR